MNQYNVAARRQAQISLQPGGHCDDKVSGWELSRTVAAAITGRHPADPATHQLARTLNSLPTTAQSLPTLTQTQKRAVLDAVQAFFPQDAADRLAGPPTRNLWGAISSTLKLQG